METSDEEIYDGNWNSPSSVGDPPSSVGEDSSSVDDDSAESVTSSDTDDTEESMTSSAANDAEESSSTTDNDAESEEIRPVVQAPANPILLSQDPQKWAQLIAFGRPNWVIPHLVVLLTAAFTLVSGSQDPLFAAAAAKLVWELNSDLVAVQNHLGDLVLHQKIQGWNGISIFNDFNVTAQFKIFCVKLVKHLCEKPTTTTTSPAKTALFSIVDRAKEIGLESIGSENFPLETNLSKHLERMNKVNGQHFVGSDKGEALNTNFCPAFLFGQLPAAPSYEGKTLGAWMEEASNSHAKPVKLLCTSFAMFAGCVIEFLKVLIFFQVLTPCESLCCLSNCCKVAVSRSVRAAYFCDLEIRRQAQLKCSHNAPLHEVRDLFVKFNTNTADEGKSKAEAAQKLEAEEKKKKENWKNKNGKDNQNAESDWDNSGQQWKRGQKRKW